MEQDTTKSWEESDSVSLYSHPLAKAFLSKVYAWMAVSMLVTAGVAVYCADSEALMQWTLENSILVLLGTLGIILAMVFCRGILTAGALGVLLMVFAAAEGLLIGPLFLVYTQQSLASTFACTAGAFGAMSVYGAVTKRELGPWGRGLLMALFGLIICGLVQCFVQSSMFSFCISVVGVIVFSLFTAYDTQKILRDGLVLKGSDRAKGAIFGALDLYLDFLNLFLYLLRLLGERK